MKDCGLELDKRSTHTKTKGEKDKGAHSWHVPMTAQRTKAGGTGINKRGFPGIMREAQLAITIDRNQAKLKLCTP